MSLKVVPVSPVLFWVQQFLEASWAATNLTQSLLQSLENSCGLAMATHRSQKLPGLCLCFGLFFFSASMVHPTFPPHAEHQKLIVPSAEQRSKPSFSKDSPDAAKAGNLFPVFLWIAVSSPHALQAFPHRCPGSFHLIKMHMQQREISKVIGSYMVWNVIVKCFFLPADYRGRHR